MKYFIYKINIDNQMSKKIKSIKDIDNPLDLIKLLALEEYKAKNFNKIFLSKEIYIDNQLVDIINWKIDK